MSADRARLTANVLGILGWAEPTPAVHAFVDSMLATDERPVARVRFPGADAPDAPEGDGGAGYEADVREQLHGRSA